MSNHITHRIHQNSRAAYRELDRQTRAETILETLGKSPVPMTDREIRDALGFTEMNMVRPTITNLLDDGRLIEVGSTLCEETKRTVRLVTVCRGVPKPRGCETTREIIAQLRAENAALREALRQRD